ncbi:uncharacterized protein LOC129587054 [Paramacrobiotus metropolitanus]|uniref:uncharacterized protein LOC129587054 n=1 Tax=Paramacrobiotus metropolitanus TaxID=2943436 RepID=UPI0024463D16|nr:uncharacterized protein LOC129587054 [Paramacrobiotus metropolitanus]
MSAKCCILLLSAFSVVRDVKSANDTVPDRPVMVIAVPQNSVVNVTFEHSSSITAAPFAFHNDPINTTAMPFLSNTSVGTTGILNSTLFTFAPNNVTFAPVVVNFTGNTITTSKPAVDVARVPTAVAGYEDAFLLPLGSEGPNAFRDGPINAQLPAGTILDPAVTSIPAVESDPSKVFISRNWRIEIKFGDFQMQCVDNASAVIDQPLAISVKYIVGSPPPVIAPNEEAVLAQGDMPVSSVPMNNNKSAGQAVIHHNMTLLPENLSGFQQIYNGTYDSTANNNKISIQKIVTAELCGKTTDFQQGYIEVSIKPTMTTSDHGAPEGYYKCFVIVNYTPAARESESFWSLKDDCESFVQSNHFKYNLWFQTRQYFIDTAACQARQARPMLNEHH